ncbi:hypothetical protein [Pseudonocardia sp. T1-2H]|uniref:hypothetical protein n=1 Tax=Pseudonocardia sp. T1-2H TaxID=3128899 RepID=UPI0031016403
MLAADAPTSADWLSAWGQVGGAAATAAAVIVALWIASRDRRRLAQDRADEARGRAAMVIAAASNSSVIVTNHGQSPIRRPAVVSNSVPEDAEITWTPQGAGQVDPVCEVLAPGASVTVPGGFQRERVRDGRSEMHIYDYDRPPYGAVMTIRFIDVDGRLWSRTGLESPELVAANEQGARVWKVGRLSRPWSRRAR